MTRPCREKDTCPNSSLRLCILLLEKWGGGGIFLFQYLKYTLPFNHSFYMPLLTVLIHLCPTWKILLVTTMQTTNKHLSLPYYWYWWSPSVLLHTTQHELFLFFFKWEPGTLLPCLKCHCSWTNRINRWAKINVCNHKHSMVWRKNKRVLVILLPL